MEPDAGERDQNGEVRAAVIDSSLMVTTKAPSTTGASGILGRSGARALGLFLFLLVAAGLKPAIATSETSSSQHFMIVRDCQEQQAFVDGDAAAVASQLPRRYTAVSDPSTNDPVLFFRAERCRGVTVNGQTAPVSMASFGIVIQTPDGTGCASAVPGIGAMKGDVPPACNWYTLAWFANSRAVVDWFHTGVPGFPAQFANGLRFDLGALDATQGGAPFHFSISQATGSPFTMQATTRQRPGQLSVRGGYWADTPQGVVKLVFASDDLTSGDATGMVAAPAGSRVATLLGADQRPYLPGYSGIAAEHWNQGVYRQQWPGPRPDTTSFAGSCSMHGTVTFSPPATDSTQALQYSYPSNGACNGALDGKHVSNIPATLYLAGSSYGSCSQAQTTTPGQGNISFGPGRVIGINMDFTTAATEVNETIYGGRSGMAPAHGTFLTQRTSPNVVLQCAGSGARSVPMDLSLSTETPLVSTNHQPTG